ncbi:MAG TPA: hypothetical protein GX697_06210, partial [Firmicutes bacterium]|nr:hypothetical protein [Bacillota bacterium]
MKLVQALVFATGSSYRQGVAHGLTAGHLAAENLKRFWAGLSCNGYQKKDIIRQALKNEDILKDHTLEEISGIAAGANLSYEELLAFNLYHGLVLPEECTVMMAVGSASASGSTVFAKNSDKIGDESLVGDRFYRNKEINVILFSEAKDGGRIVGVSAAGSTGLKMGLNDKGIAAGTNISRTVELAQRKVNITQLRAVDRAQLIRDGLEYNTALDAVSYVAKKVAENPMATPGNVEFAEARVAYIMEGSYDRVALKRVEDDVDSRSN